MSRKLVTKNWLQKIGYKKWYFCYFFLVLYINLKLHITREKRHFISIHIQKLSKIGSLQQLIDKAGSTTSFSSEEAFPI